TWSHGLDVADTLGVTIPPTDRLRHVAHIGVTTRGWSYVNRGREVPPGDVRVELAAPSAAVWTWGPEGAADKVSGPALDFCLVVTQRRHPQDTAIVTEGPLAEEWMSLAQAFAGPPTLPQADRRR
ncbi:MAG: maleylpyruvate isomerase family mycothiol-dependent enzyme, partial [Acidimicrobiia bacterium]|nr:maleylpyruvate isomerase family mycothiol-dependent enzyme [Acidimicrobiia bacterium]